MKNINVIIVAFVETKAHNSYTMMCLWQRGRQMEQGHFEEQVLHLNYQMEQVHKD